MNRLPDFSVAMAIYRNDRADDFKEAVRSVYTHQTVKPSEIIIVVDGPIPDVLEQALTELKTDIPVIRLVRFDENRGHAAARQAGLDAASNNLIAVMDADDIAVPDRFMLQLREFSDYPDAAVIGGQIDEFIGSKENIVGKRNVPLCDRDIKKYLKSRCPMNLVTVMYRKDAVESVGGFIDWYCEEDYYLWIRLAKAGHGFRNIDRNLVNVRIGKEMYQRRGGWNYFKSEARLQRLMLRESIIAFPQFAYNVTGRFVVQVAMPNSIRGFVFRKLFRKSM